MTLNFIRILTATLAATLELTRAQKLAPLEFADSGNSIYLGAWYDRYVLGSFNNTLVQWVGRGLSF